LVQGNLDEAVLLHGFTGWLHSVDAMVLSAAFSDLVLRSTDKEYPLEVHVPHALISVTRYRIWRAAEKEPRQWFFDLLVSFYSHSQGGGAGAVALIDSKSILAYITRPDLTHYHLIAWLAVYWSPFDVVFRTIKLSRHPLRLFCVAMDALDAITSTCGLVDKARKMNPKNMFLPAMVGVLLYNSGAFFRWCDERSRGLPSKTFLAQPNSGVARGALLATIYCWLGRVWRGGKHRNSILVAISLLEVSAQVIEDAMNINLLSWAHKPLFLLLGSMQRRLHLGPAEKCE